MIHDERVIASEAHLPGLLDEALSTVATNAVLLDVGSGDGRLCRALSIRPDITVVGLEYDHELARTQDRSGGEMVVAGDAAQLPFAAEVFDAVAAVNVLHEVVTAPEEEERFLQLRATIKGLTRVLRDNGSLVIYDGFMPACANERASIRPLNHGANMQLQRFTREYTAKQIKLSSSNKDEVDFSMNMGSVVAYLTKYDYLVDGSAWEGERHQLYPFTELADIAAALRESGLTIDEIRFPEPASRKGLRRFLHNYLITQDGIPYSTDTFPSCQMLIKAHK